MNQDSSRVQKLEELRKMVLANHRTYEGQWVKPGDVYRVVTVDGDWLDRIVALAKEAGDG